MVRVPDDRSVHQPVVLIQIISPCLGVSLAWYGFIPNEQPHAATTGSYSIDGQSAVNFTLKGLTATKPITIYSQKFFETATLPYGPHNITVSFQGNKSTTPLTLDYLVVQMAPEVTSASTSSLGSSLTGKYVGPSTSTPSPGSSPTGKNVGSNMNNTSSKNNAGVIAGGIVGAVGLILLAYLLFLCYRREQRKQQNLRDKDIPSMGVEPFLGEGADQHSTTALPNHMWDRTHSLTLYGTDVDANTEDGYQLMPKKIWQEMQASSAVARQPWPQQPDQTSSSRSDFSLEATGSTGTSDSGKRLAM